MKANLTSLQTVADLVAKDDVGKQDYLCPVETLDYEVVDETRRAVLVTSAWRFRMSQHAEGQLCERLGIPARYLRKCPHWLRVSNVRHWLEQFKAKGGQVLLRTKGDVLRAFLSSSYVPFDNKDLLDVLSRLPAVDSGLLPNQGDVALTDVSFHLPLLQSQPFEVKLNGHTERFFLGVYLRNSEVGFHRVSLSACLHRFVCGNVFVSRELLGQIHLRFHPDVLKSKLADFITKAVELTSPKLVNALVEAVKVEMPPTQRDRTFAQAGKLVGKPKLLLEAFRECYEQEKLESGSGDTLFTVCQALTRAAQRLGDADQRFTLSRYATELLPRTNGSSHRQRSLWNAETVHI